VRRRIGPARGEIEAEAARYLGFSFGELGAKEAKLWIKLDEIGAELLAGRHYFKNSGTRDFNGITLTRLQNGRN
jgi:hypothetical protein